MRRWTHLHSGFAGAIGGAAVLHNGWLLLVVVGVAFVAGWVARGFRGMILRGARAGGAILAARALTELERGKRVRAARRLDLERARNKREDRERAERLAYWQGTRDGATR